LRLWFRWSRIHSITKKGDPMSSPTLSLQTIDYPFETLVQRATANPPKLILNPDFQRKYKWDSEGWSRASKFIESCFMRIPLPSCYFAETKNGEHSVIDGVQRITTIVKFMRDEFALEDLTIFKDLEGKKFSQIGRFQSDLETTTIRCIVLRHENPQELITEIFARLNQGAVKLSEQEIRHALFAGEFDKLLHDLSQDPIIRDFGLGKSGKARRDSRESEELVLRYFAFSEVGKSYEGNLSKFLDNYMSGAVKFDTQEIKRLTKKFKKSLKACLIVFDKDEVFTDITKSRNRQGVVYYDLLMNSLGEIDEKILQSKRVEIRNAFSQLLNSADFKKLTVGGLQRKSSINKRNNDWRTELKAAIS